MKLTRAEKSAIEYIGRHRKTHTYPRRKSCPVSVRTANKLARRGLVMWVGSDWVMLTYRGELLWTEWHPYSKWRIK